MKKALILLTLIFLTAAALHCADRGAGNKVPAAKTFTFSQTNLSTTNFLPGDLTKYKSSGNSKFVSKLEEHSQTFLYLAIGFTIGSGVALTLGIVGSVLWGVYYYSAPYGALWAAWTLTGIGWGLFPLLFIAAIVFWVFYAIPFFSSKKSAMRMEPIERGIALTWKL